jgi:hypothetical protein
MITFEGKNHIKRYLAGFVPAIAQSMTFGIGNRAENASDIALHLETTKSTLNLTSYDFANNKLVYKASIPEEYIGKIYEVGLYSLPSDPAAGDYASRALTTFDSATEEWLTGGVASTYTTTNTRIGTDSLSQTPAASASATTVLSNIALDLSGYSAADSFTFAFNVGNANTASIQFRFLTDTGNYYTTTLGAQTAGYKIVEVTKGSFVATGAPNWGNITQIWVVTTSGAGGASAVDFDAIRIEDKDAASLDYILVARKVLATPVTKIAGMSQDVEFSLDVTL